MSTAAELINIVNARPNTTLDVAGAADLTEDQLDILSAINTDAERRDYIATRPYGIKAANQLLKRGLVEKFEGAVKYPGSKYDRMLVFFRATEAGAEILAKHGLRR